MLLSRYQFHKLQCEKGYTFDQWMTVLCMEGKQCNFSTSVTEHIHEQFIIGVNENKMQEMI